MQNRMRCYVHLKALIICVVKRWINKCGLFRKQFTKIPLKTYFHICFGSDELWWWWWWWYHQEIILRIHLQMLPSISYKMSWSVVCRGQWLETASVSTSVKLLSHEHGLHMINLLQNFKKGVAFTLGFRWVYSMMLIVWMLSMYKHFFLKVYTVNG